MNNDNLEINLFKLIIKFSKLWKFIVAFTIIFTIIVSYSYLTLKATPYYVSTVKIQIGNYFSATPSENNSGIPFKIIQLDNIKDLEYELKANFMPGTSFDDGIITSISNSYKGESLIEIQGRSTSRDDLINKLSEVSNYIFLKHNNTIAYIKRRATSALKVIVQDHKFDILQIDNRINFIENIKLPQLKNKIITFSADAVIEEEYFKKNTLIKNKEASDLLKFEILKLKNRKKYLNETVIPYLEDKSKETAIKINSKIENEIYSINEIQLPAHFKKVAELNQIILEETANLELISGDSKLLKERALKSPSIETVIHLYKTELIDYESEILILKEQLKFLLLIIQNYGSVDILLNNSMYVNGSFYKQAPSLVIDLQGDLLNLESTKDGYVNDSKLISIEILQLESELRSSLSKVFPELSPDQLSIKNVSSTEGAIDSIFVNKDSQMTILKQEKSNLENSLKQVKISRLLVESEFEAARDLASESLDESRFKESSLSGEINTSLRPSQRDKVFFVGFIFFIGLMLSILLVLFRDFFQAISLKKPT